MIRVIHLRGTHEPLGDNNCPSMVFLNALDHARMMPILVQFPADYGTPTSFAESNAIGRAQAIDQIRMAPDRVVLSGYSAGAFIVGDLAADIGAGKVAGIDATAIIACALLADPLRPEGAAAPGIPAPPGYGISGQRPVPGVLTLWGTAPDDPIAALAADNPLRTVADLSTLWSLDPLYALPWATDVMHKLIYRQLQPWWMHPFRPAEQLGEAIDALNGYLWQGRHTTNYGSEGICVRLAEAVNAAVTG